MQPWVPPAIRAEDEFIEKKLELIAAPRLHYRMTESPGI
jgi:hypothetical protein